MKKTYLLFNAYLCTDLYENRQHNQQINNYFFNQQKET